MDHDEDVEVDPLAFLLMIYGRDAPRCVTCGRPFAKIERKAGWITCEHCPTPESDDLAVGDDYPLPSEYSGVHHLHRCNFQDR